MSTFDPVKFKAAQRQGWDSVAQGWRKWWKTFEDGAQGLSDQLIEMSEIKPGYRVLDIATGIGEPAITAAKRVGPSGRVLATDIAPQMLAIAEERARESGLHKVMEFQLGDAETFALPKSGFNAVTCRFGLMFMPRISSMLAAIHAALVPGGKFAAAVWSEPSRVPALDLPMSIARKKLNVAPPAAGTPGPFSLADSAVLQQLFVQAGFHDVQAKVSAVTFAVDSAEEFANFHRDINAPLNAILASHSSEKQKEVWEAITEAARQHASSDGSIALRNEAVCVAGRR